MAAVAAVLQTESSAPAMELDGVVAPAVDLAPSCA